MAIGTIATLRIQEGKDQEFEEIFREMEAAVRANEPGNNFYSCHRTDDPTVYIVLEQYADQAALDAHRASDHFRTIGARLGGVMAARPELQSLESIS